MQLPLDYIKNQRGLPFVEKGMKVVLSYSGKTKTGIITGANWGGNLNVRFEGNKNHENLMDFFRAFMSNGLCFDHLKNQRLIRSLLRL